MLKAKKDKISMPVSPSTTLSVEKSLRFLVTIFLKSATKNRNKKVYFQFQLNTL